VIVSAALAVLCAYALLPNVAVTLWLPGAVGV
jgi:hypothetical protein